MLRIFPYWVFTKRCYFWSRPQWTTAKVLHLKSFREVVNLRGRLRSFGPQRPAPGRRDTQPRYKPWPNTKVVAKNSNLSQKSQPTGQNNKSPVAAAAAALPPPTLKSGGGPGRAGRLGLVDGHRRFAPPPRFARTRLSSAESLST